MKKILATIVLLCLLPIPKIGQAGTYNTFSRLAYCNSWSICLHEIAHALDQQAGFISQSDEYKAALQMYLLHELRRPVLQSIPVTVLEMTYRGKDTSYTIMEIYAYFFVHADGRHDNMPVIFREFYDWQKAGELTSRVNDNQKIYWLR